MVILKPDELTTPIATEQIGTDSGDRTRLQSSHPHPS